MLAKLTSKNQLTLPKSIVQQAGAEYFEVSTENGRVILTPVKIQRADCVREKLDALGISEDDVLAAIAWARKDAGEFPQDAGALINEDHVPRPGLTARAGPEKTRKRETVGLGPRAFPVIFRSAGTDPHCLQTGRPGPGRNGCLCRRL